MALYLKTTQSAFIGATGTDPANDVNYDRKSDNKRTFASQH